MHLSLAALVAAFLALSTARPYYPSHSMSPRDIARVLDFGLATTTTTDLSILTPPPQKRSKARHPLAPLHGQKAKTGQRVVLGSPSMCKPYDGDWLRPVPSAAASPPPGT